MRMAGGMQSLVPAASRDIAGGPDPAGWRYQLDLFRPPGNLTVRGPARAMVHARYSADPETPRIGAGPIRRAALTTTLASGLEGPLGKEASACGLAMRWGNFAG